jgi:tetraacyldisaccharide-1-P 4'-kinase
LKFADHHDFPPRSLERIEEARVRTSSGAVVVTAKDRVKIEGRLAVHEIRLSAVMEPSFWPWLDAALSA